MEQRKKIAIFITEWDRDAWKLILKGIQDCAMAAGYHLYIFSCYGGIDSTQKRDSGEYNIFHLVNLKEFDGAIVVANTIVAKEIADWIFAQIKAAQIPAVSLEIQADGVDTLGIDNEKAMRQMVEHFLMFHQYKRVAFVTGPEHHKESRVRLKAYLDVLSELNYPIDETDIFNGSFEIASGHQAARYFYKHPKGLPRAIICANDEMAMGMIREFESLGVAVPQEVAISGFDNVESAANYVPRITTVDRPKTELGFHTCDYLIKKIEDRLTGQEIKILPSKTVYRESCGCHSTDAIPFDQFRKYHFRKKESDERVAVFMSLMTEKLTDCDTFSQQKRYIMEYLPNIKCHSFFICMDPSIDYNDDIPTINTSELGGTDLVLKKIHQYGEFLRYGYPYEMSVPVAYYSRQFWDVENFQTRKMLPHPEWYEDKPHVFLFTPIHFQDACLGYSVCVDGDLAIDRSVYYQSMLNLGNSTENIRRKQMLNLAISRLDEMYVRDSLTGLYNRFGFARYGEEMLHKAKEQGASMMVMFIDMNGLKSINDEFGHEEGDEAIKILANALLKLCRQKDIVVRYGGDEFIYVGMNYVRQQVEDRIEELKKTLYDAYLKNKNLYQVSASVGYYIIKPDETIALDQAISLADQAMYHNKYSNRE